MALSDVILPVVPLGNFKDPLTGDYLKSLVQTISDRDLEIKNSINAAEELIVKRDNQIVNNSSTLVEDTYLKFEVMAGEFAMIQLRAVHSGNSTADFKCDFSVPSGAYIYWMTTGGIICDTDDNVVADNLTANPNTKSFGASSTLLRAVDISGVYAGGPNAGTVCFRWAQNTPTVVDTYVWGFHSWIKIWRI